MAKGIAIKTISPSGQVLSTQHFTTGADDTVFDQVNNNPPQSRTPATFGRATRKPYTPEVKQVLGWNQFSTNPSDIPYFDPSFKFILDIGGDIPFADRKKLGINAVSQFGVTEAGRDQVSAGEGLIIVTESGPHSGIEGFGVYNTPLNSYIQIAKAALPSMGYGNLAGFRYVMLNIETSSGMTPGPFDAVFPGFGLNGSFSKNSQATTHGFPIWDDIKNNSTYCEADGVTRTWLQLAQMGSGAWYNEIGVRRANRFVLLMQELRRRSAPGTQVSWGGSMHQGRPRTDFAGNTSTFIDGDCKVIYAGGDAQGNVTLDGYNYKLQGSIWDNEDFMTGYWYNFDFEMDQSDRDAIFTNKTPGTQTYEYLWSKIKPMHIVASEKGYWQENRRIMRAKQGKTRPIIRLIEKPYEGATRVPFAELQGSIAVPGYADTPKVWQPPYEQYSRVAVNRFLMGDTPNSGLYQFPEAPGLVTTPVAQVPFYNQLLHPVTAMVQARIEMQPLESFFPGSTLVENPEVQENQTGSWVAYNGVDADPYNDGVTGTPHPTGALRFKQDADGITVWLLAGMKQGYNDTRTDLWRVPNGGLNGALFRMKLIGPEAQWYEFRIKNGEQGLIYDALPTLNTSTRRAGYAGRIV